MWYNVNMETGIFKNKYKTESARKMGYDYTSNGWYFVTVCIKNKEPFFGNIADGKMNLSEIGKIAEKYWREIPKHFPFTELNEFIVMPNHIHGIVGINRDIYIRRDGDLSRLNCARRRDGDLSRLRHAEKMRQSKYDCATRLPRRDKLRRDKLRRDESRRDESASLRGGVTGKNNPMGKNSLGEIIRWYKGRCTFEIKKMLNSRDGDSSCLYTNFAWQPRFYDRVVRNEKELDRIRKYIFDNVLKWEFDRNNPNVETAIHRV